jgi:hypothetical protein
MLIDNIRAAYSDPRDMTAAASASGPASSAGRDAGAAPRAAALQECASAVASLWPGDRRAEIFAEALKDGLSPALAVKMAQRLSGTPHAVPAHAYEAGAAAAKQLLGEVNAGQAHDAGAAAAKELISKAGFAQNR